MERIRAVVLLLILAVSVAAGRPAGDQLTSILRGLTEDQLKLLEREISDDWEMMSDQPTVNDTNKAIKDSLDPLSGRDKEQRIKNIREQVLRLLGRKENRNGTQPSEHQARVLQIISKIKTVSQWPGADVYTELQSFYPTCEIPRNTDEEAWDKGSQMNLFFNLNFSSSSTVSIQWAKLRLYKLPQGNTTIGVTEGCAGELANKKQFLHFPAGSTTIPIEEKQLRVSVYWYTRGLRKHRVKRKLLDSQMISLYGESWTEYNVKPAVKAWREHGKNFGISVEVEDEDRVLVKSSSIFVSMNCSREANIAQPIPSMAVEKLDNNTRQVLRPFSQLYPVIELSYREFPESEIQYPTMKLRHHHQDLPQINDTMAGGIKWEDPTDIDVSSDR